MKHPEFGTKLYCVSGTNIYSGVLTGVSIIKTKTSDTISYFVATPRQTDEWKKAHKLWKERSKKEKYSYEPRIRDFGNQWPSAQCYYTIGEAALAISKAAIVEYGEKLAENRRKKPRGKKRSK